MSTTLSVAQARSVDRIAVDQFGMNSLVLMENAGRGVADVVTDQCDKGMTVICCGKGNNAGDGFVVARHMAIRQWPVRVVLLVPPEQLQGDAAANFAILQKTDIPIFTKAPTAEHLRTEFAQCKWIVDALLGTGVRGEPREPFNRTINVMNQHQSRRIALDIPSGLDGDTGQPSSTTIRADITCSFVAAKPGLLSVEAQPYVGELQIVDIGVPTEIISIARTSTA